MSKSYDFHRNNGHTTEECIGLKNMLEDLARKGLLSKYVVKTRPRSPETPDDRRDNARRRGPVTHQETRVVAQTDPSSDNFQGPIRGMVETIAGGFAGGGPSSSARKRGLRSVMHVAHREQELPKDRYPIISFTQDDFKGLDQNLDEPMVISLVAANYLVKRVLVDQGSSADIIFYSAFKKLDLSDNQLKPYSGILVVFTGEPVNV